MASPDADRVLGEPGLGDEDEEEQDEIRPIDDIATATKLMGAPMVTKV